MSRTDSHSVFGWVLCDLVFMNTAITYPSFPHGPFAPHTLVLFDLLSALFLSFNVYILFSQFRVAKTQHVSLNCSGWVLYVTLITFSSWSDNLINFTWFACYWDFLNNVSDSWWQSKSYCCYWKCTNLLNCCIFNVQRRRVPKGIAFKLKYYLLQCSMLHYWRRLINHFWLFFFCTLVKNLFSLKAIIRQVYCRYIIKTFNACCPGRRLFSRD